MKSLKSLAAAVDRKLFVGQITKVYSNLIDENMLHKYRFGSYGFGFDVEYGRHPSILNVLCDKYGSDKGEVTSDGNPYPWLSHTYADVYELLFQIRRNDVRLVIECGLGTNDPDKASSMGVDGKPGASLRVWRDYFPRADVIGLDIDEDILFDEDRIRTFACDQTSAGSVEGVIRDAGIADRSADIIIDDGLHEFKAGVAFFESIGRCLSTDGMHVIEDVARDDYTRYKDYFAERSASFTARFFSLRRPGLPVGDNRLIVVTRSS